MQTDRRPVETPITLPELARLENLLRRQLVRISTSVSDGISRRDTVCFHIIRNLETMHD